MEKNHRYLPMTENDRREMLDTVGASDVAELFSDIPESVRHHSDLNVREALSEHALVEYFQSLASKNETVKDYPSFLGAGVYDHHIPSTVDAVISRSEFYTAYTPYQPEVSQGELQAIFEFQSMIATLTGMEMANSSLYDGHTALAEGALMAATQKRMKKQTILISETVHPETRDVVQTFLNGPKLSLETIPSTAGKTDVQALKEMLNDDIAGVLIEYPNFYGTIEDLKALREAADAVDALLIVKSNPLALGVLTPPGEFGADIVVGDTQPFGIMGQYGGPHCGYFATKKTLMRKVPGRLVGETVDEEGQRGYVMTLQAREQHIRRDKATSNICSNQALNALASSVAMAAFGKKGVKEMAIQNVQKAHYAKTSLQDAGFSLVYDGPHFNEFVIDVGTSAADVNKALFAEGMIGGLDLGRFNSEQNHHMLVCVTELRAKAEIDRFVEALKVAK
ncbi:aminomethyl-transferring glycine dehydrogenase subunit GcvPA [Salicibibacter halophilus]|uniref:Probable glycine dehydrogenase (decarboxylating) subunit 1 n=1 Tax=Salicibibacter halophilus TaxID=2502791 RepID=A0A514LM32_9BACI|nr:aminomethyl-transferring glycine dehydrogenase subunit GcvPA [Salicibibacter halophilus]QDI92924.1 aminomethyl-transferring glycine dehydrogenase subunit GcvPA [Salicibibacter halophilus]